MRAFKIGLIPLLYKLRSRYLTRDAELDNIASTKGAYEYLKRYSQKVEEATADDGEKGPVRYWTCWLQGEKNAPKIVQVCLNSIKQHVGTERLTLLTEENIKEYVTIPEHIARKYEKGIISRTHYSDVVRLILLEQYGGIWIDSTILMTGAMPDVIEKSPFFVYKWPEHGKIALANNFIAARAHNPIIRYTLGMILDYWKHENKLVSYSIMHIALTFATEAYPELWEEVPYIPGELEYLMNYKLGKEYSEEDFKRISSLTPIHKLTYKTKQFGIDPDKKGTFFDIICNNGIKYDY